MASTEPITAFVSFPSPYTETLLVRALAATLPAVSISNDPPSEENPPKLQWADYDLMTFDKPHANDTYLISSYVYRKALIRKHQLHTTVAEYLAKSSHRGESSVLAAPASGGVGGIPKGWTVDVQFADELDELLMDDLYELQETMDANAQLAENEERQWFILKPGFADRAQGIRMFSTEDELRAIFEEFEPPSDDEEEEDDEDDEESALAKQAAATNLEDEDEDEDEKGDTNVLISQLRHFVIQEYLPRPILFDLEESATSPAVLGQKFHLRAYALVTGGWTVHVAHTMLALFSGAPYASPQAVDGELDLRPHLTNTCLQTDGFGAPVVQDDLVRLFWDLEGLTALAATPNGRYEPRGKVTAEWLEATFAKVGAVIAESVKAGAECGSFGLQLMPNAFEIFGVDLIVSFPPTSSASTLPTPDVTLLEFNASPDFQQTGETLRHNLLDMFKGVVRISIAPFFGIEREEEGREKPMEVGDERHGWRMVGRGEVRGNWGPN